MNKTIKNHSGHTLAEVLVAMGIFMIFVSATVIMYVQGVRTFRAGERKTRLIQEARLGMERMSREFKKAFFILYPDEATLSSEGSSVVVFQDINGRIEGFSLNNDEHTLQWVLYSSDFDASLPDQQEPTESRTVSRKIESVYFMYEDADNPQLLSFWLNTQTENKDQVSLYTKIFIRH